MDGGFEFERWKWGTSEGSLEYKKEQPTPGEAWSADIDALTFWLWHGAPAVLRHSPWLLPPWRISQRATAKGARPGRPQLLWDARPPDGMPRSHQSNGLDTGTPQKNELLLAAGQMTFRV
jgi:hypothetical protein